MIENRPITPGCNVNVCHRHMRPCGGLRGQRLTTWGTSLGSKGMQKETCGKDITLCSTIRPIGYDFESGGHLVRACLCSADIDQSQSYA